jgi:hypothetical protein
LVLTAAGAGTTGITASLIDAAGNVSSGQPFDLGTGINLASTNLAWTYSDGSFFFQTAMWPLPQQWEIRWTLPDGETCDAPFSVN